MRHTLGEQTTSDNTVTLVDGRKLGYALYGDRRGKPLFFFHGWPGSRLRAAVYSELAQALHIRLISIDRPGIGLSDAQPQRAIRDWPADLVQVANYLQIDQFAVLGISGGGVYAAVSAYALSERITKAGIAVAPAPINTPGLLDSLPLVYKLGWLGYSRVPAVAYLSSLFHSLAAKRFPKMIGATYRSEADQAVYKQYGKALLVAKQECFRQGFGKAAHDVVIGTRAWGFDVSAIQAKVYLWYGDADPAIPVQMGQYLAGQIAGSELTVYAGEGHLISIGRAGEILGRLAASN